MSYTVPEGSTVIGYSREDTQLVINLADKETSPAYYMTMQDAGRTAFLLGPFAAESDCRRYAYDSREDGGDSTLHHAIQQIVYEVDPKTHFASWGMAKTETAIRTGILHSLYPHGELEAMIQNRGGVI